MDSDTDSSEDEGEISSPEVKALQAAASKVKEIVGRWCYVTSLIFIPLVEATCRFPLKETSPQGKETISSL